MTMTNLDLDDLRAKALAVTPGDLDTVPNPPSEYGGHSAGSYECPACGGQGEVEGETYCNFDGVALGVQFFGIGNDHKNYEAFFRAFSPAVCVALLDEIATLKARAGEAVDAVKEADAGIKEWFRYLHGGEMRGSYDGKPERDQLRKAGYATTAFLARLNARQTDSGERG